MPRPKPRWPKDSISLLDARAEEFKADLRILAAATARHDGDELVLSRHIEIAFNTLSRMGFDRQPWYRNASAEVAYGCATMGLATAVPDVMSMLGESDFIAAWTWGVMLALFFAGLYVTARGWLRSTGRG